MRASRRRQLLRHHAEPGAGRPATDRARRTAAAARALVLRTGCSRPGARRPLPGRRRGTWPPRATSPSCGTGPGGSSPRRWTSSASTTTSRARARRPATPSRQPGAAARLDIGVAGPRRPPRRTEMGWPVDADGSSGVLGWLQPTYPDCRRWTHRERARLPRRASSTVRSPTASASRYLDCTCARSPRPSRRASRCAATSTGRCWTTSSGPRVRERFGLVRSTTRPRSGAQGELPLVPGARRARRSG